MHCMDSDYSLFSLLPPYNNLRSQVIDRTTGREVKGDLTVTYESIADPSGSCNSSSSGKTNFWTFCSLLFGLQPGHDVGLAGNRVQSQVPQAMAYDTVKGCFKADGIPSVPTDDQGQANMCPMVVGVKRLTVAMHS